MSNLNMQLNEQKTRYCPKFLELKSKFCAIDINTRNTTMPKQRKQHDIKLSNKRFISDQA